MYSDPKQIYRAPENLGGCVIYCAEVVARGRERSRLEVVAAVAAMSCSRCAAAACAHSAAIRPPRFWIAVRRRVSWRAAIARPMCVGPSASARVVCKTAVTRFSSSAKESHVNRAKHTPIMYFTALLRPRRE